LKRRLGKRRMERIRSGAKAAVRGRRRLGLRVYERIGPSRNTRKGEDSEEDRT